MDKNTHTGVSYPTIVVGGSPVLTVKLDFFAEYELSRAGLSLNDCVRILASKAITGVRDPRLVANILDMFAACVAENYDSNPPTASQWAKAINQMEEGLRDKTFKQIVEVVNTAVEKRWLAGKATAAQPANVQPISQETPAPAELAAAAE